MKTIPVDDNVALSVDESKMGDWEIGQIIVAVQKTLKDIEQRKPSKIMVTADGRSIDMSAVIALYMCDYSIYAVYNQEPMLIDALSKYEHAVMRIKELAKYCRDIYRINGTNIYVNKNFTGIPFIDCEFNVYVCVYGVVIYINHCTSYTDAKKYCDELETELFL